MKVKLVKKAQETLKKKFDSESKNLKEVKSFKKEKQI